MTFRVDDRRLVKLEVNHVENSGQKDVEVTNVRVVTLNVETKLRVIHIAWVDVVRVVVIVQSVVHVFHPLIDDVSEHAH